MSSALPLVSRLLASLSPEPSPRKARKAGMSHSHAQSHPAGEHSHANPVKANDKFFDEDTAETLAP